MAETWRYLSPDQELHLEAYVEDLLQGLGMSEDNIRTAMLNQGEYGSHLSIVLGPTKDDAPEEERISDFADTLIEVLKKQGEFTLRKLPIAKPAHQTHHTRDELRSQNWQDIWITLLKNSWEIVSIPLTSPSGISLTAMIPMHRPGGFHSKIFDSGFRSVGQGFEIVRDFQHDYIAETTHFRLR